MKFHNPQNWEELCIIRDSIRKDGLSPYLAVYRGQSEDWSIKSGVARSPELGVEKVLTSEKNLFESFLSSDISLQKHPEEKKYEYAQQWFNLFQAQHLELKTRLVDWTQDFNQALFFAVQNLEKTNKDGVLYIYKCPRDLLINFNSDIESKWFEKSVFELDKFYLVKHYSFFTDEYFESIGELRRFRQDGSFIVSPSNKILTELEKVNYLNRNMEKIILSSNLKKEIKSKLNIELNKYSLDLENINKSSEIEDTLEITSKLNKKFFN